MTTLSLVIALVLVVGCLTAAATSVRFVSRIWLRHWAEQELSEAGASDLNLDRPQRWLMAAATGIAATVFAIGAVIGVREARGAAVGQLLTAVALLMVAGQLFPRAMARRWSGLLAPVLMPLLRALEWLCAPATKFAALFVRRAAPVVPPGDADAREALEDLLREGELEGVGEASESAIISGVVEFGEKLAADVMTPRAEIVAVDRWASADSIARAVAQSKYSRIPVFDSDLDHVVGLLHSFDVLADPAQPVKSLRRVATARAATPCNELMRAMLRDHVHLAIIQGARGETIGLVTLEDLVEELVGDISDEHDEPQTVTA